MPRCPFRMSRPSACQRFLARELLLVSIITHCFLAYAALAASSPMPRSPLRRSMNAATDSMEIKTEDHLEQEPTIVAGAMDAAAGSMEIKTEDHLEQEPTIVAGAMEMTSESMLPESKPSLCVRCGTTHDNNDDEGCRLARRLASRCARCRLVHRDYDLAARIMDDMEKNDCEIYIPNVKKLQMDGYTILVPENVLKKLEEHKEDEARCKEKTED